MLALLDHKRQFYDWKKSIGWAVVCTRIELQLPNTRSRGAAWLRLLRRIIPDHVMQSSSNTSMLQDESAFRPVRTLCTLPIENSPIGVGLTAEDDIGNGATDELDGKVGCRAPGRCIEDVASNWVS